MGSWWSLKRSWRGRLLDAVLRRIKRQIFMMNCNGDWDRQEAGVCWFMKAILGESSKRSEWIL